MSPKHVICPERIRTVPAQFSWIDQRLIQNRYISKLDPPAQGLYLLLVTVADAQGLSYYGEASIGKLLRLEREQIQAAREQLLLSGLIAYKKPVYQVLSLEEARLPVARHRIHDGEPRTIGNIFTKLLDS